MLRAAVIALPLWWRRPAAEPCLFPHVGIPRGFWRQMLRTGPLAALPFPGAHDMAAGSICRPGRAGAFLAAVLLCPGCAGVAPDTLCRMPRPSAAINDTVGTRDAQAAAAKVWDRQCTLAGAWRAR